MFKAMGIAGAILILAMFLNAVSNDSGTNSVKVNESVQITSKVIHTSTNDCHTSGVSFGTSGLYCGLLTRQ